MTDQDHVAYEREFDRLAAALTRYKLDPEVRRGRLESYWHVLRKFPIELVCAKADSWLETQSEFPSPAEWAAQIVSKKADLPVLTQTESAEYWRAEQLGFEDDVHCRCRDCVAAGLPDRAVNALRYVPREDVEGRPIRARDPFSGKVITPGLWLHGVGLVRWYEARARFWALAAELKPKSMPADYKLAQAGS